MPLQNAPSSEGSTGPATAGPVGHSMWLGRTARAGDWVFGPKATLTFGWREGTLAFVLTVVGALIAFLRVPLGARNVLWAEDASVFVTSALQHRPDASLFEPYAGYMHAFPRLVTALVVGTTPIGEVPVVLTAAACVLTGVIATTVVLAFRPRLPSVLIRLTIWLGIVTLPIAGIEANGSIANSHWYLLVGLFAILITRRQNTGFLVLGGLVVAFAVLSDPLSAIFLPLVLARFVLIRKPSDGWIPTIYVVAMVIQLSVVLATTVVPAAGRPSIVEVVRTTGFRVFLAVLTGETGSVSLFLQFGLKAIAVATLVVLAIITAAVLRGKQFGGLALVSTGVAVVFFLAAAIIRWNPQYDPAVSTTWGGSRYSVVPISLLLISLGSAASAWFTGAWRQRWVRFIAPAAFAMLVIILSVPSFGTTARTSNDSWEVGLHDARQTCATSKDSHLVQIPAEPTNFVLTASCESLDF
ncbi:hypothetical protein ACVXZ4_03750 [Lacisediminihabitans sp. FW035]